MLLGKMTESDIPGWSNSIVGTFVHIGWMQQNEIWKRLDAVHSEKCAWGWDDMKNYMGHRIKYMCKEIMLLENKKLTKLYILGQSDSVA